MAESQPYDHAEINSRNQYVWSDYRLVSRYKELEKSLELPHSPERKKDIIHEMACIAVEAVLRELDIQKREAEIEMLESVYNIPSEEVEESGKEKAE